MKTVNFDQLVNLLIGAGFVAVVSIWNRIETLEQLVATVSYILVGVKMGYSKQKEDEFQELKSQISKTNERIDKL